MRSYARSAPISTSTKGRCGAPSAGPATGSSSPTMSSSPVSWATSLGGSGPPHQPPLRGRPITNERAHAKLVLLVDASGGISSSGAETSAWTDTRRMARCSAADLYLTDDTTYLPEFQAARATPRPHGRPWLSPLDSQAIHHLDAMCGADTPWLSGAPTHRPLGWYATTSTCPSAGIACGRCAGEACPRAGSARPVP